MSSVVKKPLPTFVNVWRPHVTDGAGAWGVNNTFSPAQSISFKLNKPCRDASYQKKGITPYPMGN
jgi:hypothetical protein